MATPQICTHSHLQVTAAKNGGRVIPIAPSYSRFECPSIWALWPPEPPQSHQHRLGPHLLQPRSLPTLLFLPKSVPVPTHADSPRPSPHELFCSRWLLTLPQCVPLGLREIERDDILLYNIAWISQDVVYVLERSSISFCLVYKCDLSMCWRQFFGAVFPSCLHRVPTPKQVCAFWHTVLSGLSRPKWGRGLHISGFFR